jgi:acyl carrier protein
MNTTLERVNAIVIEFVPELAPKVDSSEWLSKELGIDSLTFVDILVQVEKHFDITIEDDELATVECIQDILYLIGRSQ